MAATYQVLLITLGTSESDMETLIDEAVSAFDPTAFVRSLAIGVSRIGNVSLILIEKP